MHKGHNQDQQIFFISDYNSEKEAFQIKVVVSF